MLYHTMILYGETTFFDHKQKGQKVYKNVIPKQFIATKDGNWNRRPKNYNK